MKSFTLIELIVVIAIIAILAAIIAPNAFKAIEKARVTKTLGDLKSIKSGLTGLYADTGKFVSGCPLGQTANPDTSIDKYYAGLLENPAEAILAMGGTLPWVNPSDPTGRCTWTETDRVSWDGPYIEGNGFDFWKTAYKVDPDFSCQSKFVADCSAALPTWPDCNNNQAIKEICQENCNGACDNCKLQVVRSNGPDKAGETCDDIPALLRLN